MDDNSGFPPRGTPFPPRTPLEHFVRDTFGTAFDRMPDHRAVLIIVNLDGSLAAMAHNLNDRSEIPDILRRQIDELTDDD